MLDFFVDLSEKRVDLGGSQFSESSLERGGILRVLPQRNVVTLELGIHVHLVQHCFFIARIVMVNNGSLRSFTKRLISNVESCAFMTRTFFRTNWHILCICFNNEPPRSFMCRSNVGILSLQMNVLRLHSS